MTPRTLVDCPKCKSVSYMFCRLSGNFIGWKCDSGHAYPLLDVMKWRGDLCVWRTEDVGLCKNDKCNHYLVRVCIQTCTRCEQYERMCSKNLKIFVENNCAGDLRRTHD